MPFLNDQGLLNSDYKDIRVHDENAILYTLEYVLLIDKLSSTEPLLSLSNTLKSSMYEYIEQCRVSKGRFHQRPKKDCPIGECMSHDQLTAFIVFSKIYGFSFDEEIWQEIKDQKFGYNDWGVSWKPLHPRDVVFYGLVCGSKLWWILYPIFLLISMVSCFGTYYKRPQIDTVIRKFLATGKWEQQTLIESSAKILTFVRTFCLMPKTFKFLSWWIFKTSKFNKWSEIFAVYFPNKEHPINLYLNKNNL